ncbi:MAG TPA: hypothetical protein VFS00_28085 [Polyangiaceae bacterium]|nr:hypothetical protein [Polyangiaceae bacterium]
MRNKGRRSPAPPRPPLPEAGGSPLVQRARRLRRRGEVRKALVALREACLVDEYDAATWTLYGALLVHEGRVNDGRQALRHAVWLRRRVGDEARVRSTEALLARAA